MGNYCLLEIGASFIEKLFSNASEKLPSWGRPTPLSWLYLAINAASLDRMVPNSLRVRSRARRVSSTAFGVDIDSVEPDATEFSVVALEVDVGDILNGVDCPVHDPELWFAVCCRNLL